MQSKVEAGGTASGGAADAGGRLFDGLFGRPGNGGGGPGNGGGGTNRDDG